MTHPNKQDGQSLRDELMAMLATQREVILNLCNRVERLEMRADGLTPMERVERRWAKAAAAKKSSAASGSESAVPEGQEPAAVVEEPSDAELLELMHQSMRDDLAEVSRLAALQSGTDPGVFRVCLNYDVVQFARAVLDRWRQSPPLPDHPPLPTTTPDPPPPC